VIANFSAPSFCSTNIQAMGTIFWSWIIGGTAIPNWINTGEVVSRTRCFEISVAVDTKMSKMSSEHCSDAFGILWENHLPIRLVFEDLFRLVGC